MSRFKNNIVKFGDLGATVPIDTDVDVTGGLMVFTTNVDKKLWFRTYPNLGVIKTITYGSAQSPSGLCLTPTLIIVAMSGVTNGLWVIQRSDNTTQSSKIIAGTSNNFRGVVDSGNGSVFITDNTNGLVHEVSTSTWLKIGTSITVGSAPSGIGINPVKTKLCVANNAISSKSISIIDIATKTVTNTISVGEQPYGCCYTSDGNYILVTVQSKASVYVYDANTFVKLNQLSGYAGCRMPKFIDNKLFVPKSGYISIEDKFYNGTIAAQPETPPTPPTPLPIVIFAGQSNSEGDNVETSIPTEYAGSTANVLIFKKSTNTSTADGVVQILNPGTNNNFRTPMTGYGPETSTGKDLYAATGKQIGLIKYALGGSKLVDNGVESAGGTWEKSFETTTNSPENYKILKDYFVIPGMAGFVAAGYAPYIAAICWCQGEADTATYEQASVYETKITQFFNDLKADLQGNFPEIMNARFVITRIHNHFTAGTRPYLNEIRTALQNVGDNYPNAVWLDGDSWPVKADFTHWTKPGQTLHGQVIANDLKNYI